MKKLSEQQSIIRKYLLGNLRDESKMRQIEEKFLIDDNFDEELSIAEDELIGDYLDGALTVEERERFNRFFLITPERREKLRLIQNLKRYAAESNVQTVKQFSKEKRRGFEWRDLFSIPALRFALILIIVGGLGFAVWRAAFHQSDVEKGLAQLELAYRGQRPIESRATADFDYAPFTVTRGGNQVKADEKSLARAERFLLDATEDSSEAEAHHALGLFYLAQREFDKAVGEFNLALSLAPDNAKIHSDAGAAYLEKTNLAEQQEKGDEFFADADAALKHFNRALELNENLSEALFNKALLLQKMRLANEARMAWRQYLEKDSVSPWADEARRHLELLERQAAAPKDKAQILQDFLDAFRRRDDARAWEIVSQTKELITGVMVAPQLAGKFLAASQQSRKEEQDEILSAFVYLGELERQNSGDLYFAELADFYTNINQTQQQKLLEAYAELQTGNDLIKKTNFDSALQTFKRAQDLFISAGSVWEAQLVEHRIGYCLSQLGKFKESNNNLIKLSEFCERKSYKWMKTLADGWIGSNYSLLGDHSRAINYNQKSLQTAVEISDFYNIQKASNQLTNEYWLIGESQKAFADIYRSINFSNLYYQSPRQKSRNLLFATESLYRFKFYDAAAAFGHEEIYLAQEDLKDNWMSHTAYNQLAMIYGKAQKYREAFKAIESSFQLSNSFNNEIMRQNQNIYTRLTLAHLQREAHNCEEAINNYNQVIQYYGDSDFSINKYEARKGRLLCFTALKNDSAVKEEMPVLIQMFDENRQKLIDESNRNTFFDNEQSVYDIAADYSYVQLKDSEQAFNYAENSRARGLLNLIENNSSEPLTLSEVRQKIPDQIQIVYYAVLADKLLIWQISNSSHHSIEKPIKYDDLEEKIQNYTKLLANKSDIRDAAKDLYRIMIQPVENNLEPNKPLGIIADKMLYRLPFASLISPQTNKYLIEDYPLFFSPSATLLINETENAGQKSKVRTETVLSIGNPTFSRKEYPDLANLPDAAREAEKIGALYDSRYVFVNNEAAKEQVFNNLDKADVVHFAGHYVPNSKSSSFSKLLLAKGDLTIEEIMRKKLNHPRLIVLSACETGVEKFYRGEGMIGAARAFLASGVPLVVASQWAVDSDATAELMIKFHYYRKRQNLSTITALRQAQIDLLTGENNRSRQPFYWAGFLSVGGYAIY